MSNILKILTMLRHHLYNSITNPKVWAAGFLILAAIFKSIYPLMRIAHDFKVSVNFSAAAVPFMANYSILLVFCALLLIFSEMPFKDQQQIFLLTRSGKRSWYISQLLYIIAVALSAASVMILMSWLLLAGHVSFANSWGVVENSLCQSVELVLEYQPIGWFSSDIISALSPRQAFAWSVLVGTFTYAAFGGLVFALNIITRKIGGTIFGTILVSYHILVGHFFHPKFKWAAMLDWSNLDIIDIRRNSLYPVPEFVISVLAGGFVIAAVIAIISARKRSDIL